MAFLYRKMSKYYHLVALGLFLVIMLILHNHLYLSDVDDSFYNVVAKCDFQKIVDFLKWHYFYKNGRILVHSLVILFLKFDIYLWRITNPVLLTALVYFTGRILSCFIKNRQMSIVLSVLFYLIIDCVYLSSAVYWLSASFNYLLPVFFFVLCVYFYNEKKNTATLFCAALAGLSAEQSCMITIGFFVLMVLYKFFFLKEKKIFRELLYVSVVVVGLLTILLCPGAKMRMGNSGNELSPFSLFFRIVDIIHYNWLGTEKSIAFIILISISTCLSLVIIKVESRLFKKINIMISVLLFISCVINLCALLFCESRSGLTYIVFVAALFLGLIYNGVLIVLKCGNPFPVIMLILGTGSQLMMSVTNIWSYRTCFPGIVCFSFYILYILGKCLEDAKLKKVISIFLVSLFMVLLTKNVFCSLEYVSSLNEKVESYCKNKATLDDYSYVLSEQEKGDFWYNGKHKDFFKGKIKFSDN